MLIGFRGTTTDDQVCWAKHFHSLRIPIQTATLNALHMQPNALGHLEILVWASFSIEINIYVKFLSRIIQDHLMSCLMDKTRFVHLATVVSLLFTPINHGPASF